MLLVLQVCFWIVVEVIIWFPHSVSSTWWEVLVTHTLPHQTQVGWKREVGWWDFQLILLIIKDFFKQTQKSFLYLEYFVDFPQLIILQDNCESMFHLKILIKKSRYKTVKFSWYWYHQRGVSTHNISSSPIIIGLKQRGWTIIWNLCDCLLWWKM